MPTYGQAENGLETPRELALPCLQKCVVKIWVKFEVSDVNNLVNLWGTAQGQHNFSTIKFAVSKFYCRGISHEDKRFWTIFLYAPKASPSQKRKFYFYCRLAVSEQLWGKTLTPAKNWGAANGGVTNGGLRGVWPPFPEIGRNRPFSPFFCPFRPFLEGLKSTWKIQKTEEKGLFPQISSDFLKPPSLKPPFAAPQKKH